MCVFYSGLVDFGHLVTKGKLVLLLRELFLVFKVGMIIFLLSY